MTDADTPRVPDLPARLVHAACDAMSLRRDSPSVRDMVAAVLRELAETPIAVNEWAAARMRALSDEIEAS